MGVKRKPRCFVAMAFDHADNDGLYERQIKPVLRDNGVTAIIVNRRQSNDDLNNQIISELERCDFCIADLTYTRPSVYFEAGFAQRQVEVIYTVRKDHLKQGAKETRRVHFDLQMKPLITWVDASDPTFSTRLEKRLRSTVLRDWRSSQKTEVAKEHAEKQFASLPVKDRLGDLRRKALATFKAFGFRGWTGSCDRPPVHKTRDILAGRINFALGSRVKGTTYEIVTVQAFATVMRADLLSLEGLYSPWRIQDRVSKDNQNIRKVRVYHLVLCLQSIPNSKIESVFMDLGRAENSGHYVETKTLKLRGFDKGERVVEFTQNWNFLGSLRSLQELSKRLEDIRV